MATPRERDLALLAVGLLALAPSGLVRSEHVLCPIRRATGWPCPGCGVTRSWHAVLHGRPGASVAYHPLGPAALALVLAYAAGLDDGQGSVARGLRRPAVPAAFGAAWLAVWLARLRLGWRGR